ncbi:MAG: DUF2157 domain-containing protein [Opitutus sp.]
MSKRNPWLFAEIERWTKELIITPEQAGRLRALYPDTSTGVSWGLIVFSSLGAVVVGLGIILLLAYNWTEIPKFGKLGLIFGTLAVAHGVGLWLRWSTPPRPEIGEAGSILGSMVFGAGIWLVAQIYNIDEHFPTGFLVWGVGTLALAWALNSVPQGILAAVTLTIWGCSEVFSFEAPVDYSSALILVGIGPLVWRKQSALLGGVAIGGLAILVIANAAFWSGGGGAFTAALSLSTLLIAASRLMDETTSRRLRQVLAFFGLTGFVVCCYILSFDDTVRHVLRWTNDHQRSTPMALVYRWCLFALALGAWSGLLFKRWTRGKSVAARMEEWLCPIALLYCQALAFMDTSRGDATFVAVVFNLVCLGIATMWMVRGSREGQLKSVILGSLFFAALVFARYFDLFESLALRGVVFLVLGGVLFAEGLFYRKLRHAEETNGDAL